MKREAAIVKRMFLGAILFICFVHGAAAQALRNKINLGLYLRPALSQGEATGGLTVLDDHSFLTAGLGFYSLFRIRSEPARIPIYFIKAELGVNSRAGVFEIIGFGPVRITSSIVDASLTVPITVKLRKHSEPMWGLEVVWAIS